jgi:hypothetical protein
MDILDSCISITWKIILAGSYAIQSILDLEKTTAKS